MVGVARPRHLWAMRFLWLTVAITFAGVARADDPKVYVIGDDAIFEQAFHTGASVEWRPLCSTPCVVSTTRDGWYRVSSSLVRRPSKVFKLPGDDEVTLTIHARRGSSDSRAAGGAIAALGAVTLAGGAVALLVGEIEEAVLSFCLFPQWGCTRGDSTTADWTLGIGLAAVVVGGITLAAGLVHRAKNKAGVIVDTEPPPSSNAPLSDRPARLSPPIFGIPIFTASF